MTVEPTDLNVRLVERQPEGLDEAIRRLAAIAQQPAEPQSSVELTQNAKGVTQIVVKVYDRDPEQASATAQRLYDELAATYRTSALATDGKAA